MWYFTSPVPRCSLCLPANFVEQILRFFTQHVDQHVQTTTVRHTQHHFAGAAVAAWRIISLSIGINASPPSSEKRFAPGNFAPR
ncbi:Uncharacterised protein [Citrobacter koseri]|nr:Uncharacterised protein [Citrobacter koseri]